MSITIRVEDLWKEYRLGVFGHGMLYRDLQSWFARMRGKEDPNTLVTAEKSRQEMSGDRIWALREVSLDLHDGEVLGIIGGNGAGKSTLLKIIARVTAPTKGDIKIRGRVASLLEVGTGFHPELTGRENVFLNGAIHGMSKSEIRKRFDDIVDFAGVEQYIDTPVKRYSSGMRVRLGFAVAAHLEPEILLVDEVLAVGDLAFQKKCLGRLSDVAKVGRTVLFVSHQIPHIANLCPRCILMQDGRIVQHGSTREVIDVYVAQMEKDHAAGVRDRKDRKGNGLVRVVDAWVENERGDRVPSVFSGDGTKLVASYEVPSGEVVRNVDFAFAIHRETVGRIADPSFGIWGKAANLGPRPGRLECLIPRLPLGSGAFSFNVMIRSAGRIHEVFDWIPNACNFEVQAGDYFKSGVIPESAVLVHIDHEWAIVEN